MFNVQIALTLIHYITFLMAYLISITLAGTFTAWIAKKMGDDTPADYGFLSFDPIVHVDFLGLYFLMVYGFGWGKYIPINMHNIVRPFRVLKIIITFLARPIAYVLISVITLGIIYIFFDGRALNPYLPTQLLADVSSYNIVLNFIFIFIFTLNVWLAAVSFLINICRIGLELLFDQYEELRIYEGLVMLIVPILLFYLCGELLKTVIQNLIFLIANVLHLY